MLQAIIEYCQQAHDDSMEAFKSMNDTAVADRILGHSQAYNEVINHISKLYRDYGDIAQVMDCVTQVGFRGVPLEDLLDAGFAIDKPPHHLAFKEYPEFTICYQENQDDKLYYMMAIARKRSPHG